MMIQDYIYQHMEVLKMKKEKTISKTIRIPERVYNKIMDEAKRTNSDFCNVANYKLKHFSGGLTPDVTVRVANIANESYELVGKYAPQEIARIREDALYLCQLLSNR